MFGYGLLGLIILIGGYLVWAYNALVKNKNLVDEGWSGIDVQLRRRADLIPNLIETVKGYAAHEDKLFHDIAELRAKSISRRIGGRAIGRGPGDERRRWASSSRWPRPIRSSRPTPISATCRTSSPASRTRSRCRGATTMARSGTSTP